MTARGAAWLAVIALGAVNPARVRRLVGPTASRPVLVGSVGSGVAVGAAAIGAAPLLRALDVSPPTALIAAGTLVALAAAFDAVRRPTGTVPPAGPGAGALMPIGVPALVRPPIMVLAVAASAAGGLVAGLAVALGVVAGGVSVLVPVSHLTAGDRRRLELGDVATWAFVAVALLGGVDLVTDGVFSI